MHASYINNYISLGTYVVSNFSTVITHNKSLRIWTLTGIDSGWSCQKSLANKMNSALWCTHKTHV